MIFDNFNGLVLSHRVTPSKYVVRTTATGYSRFLLNFPLRFESQWKSGLQYRTLKSLETDGRYLVRISPSPFDQTSPARCLSVGFLTQRSSLSPDLPFPFQDCNPQSIECLIDLLVGFDFFQQSIT